MKWTDNEIFILREQYILRNGKKNDNILERVSKLTGRKKSSIRNKAYELGITKNDKLYSEIEIQFLKDNIDKMTFSDMSIILKKQESNIYRKCKQLGITKIADIKCSSKIKEVKPKYKFTPEDIKKSVETNKIKFANGDHPKGNYGHRHTEETRKKLSLASKKGWDNLYKNEKLYKERNKKQRITRIKNGTLNPFIKAGNCYSRARGGKREDLNNIYFRSSWEANLARYYNYVGVEWQFEPKTFIFEGIRKGSVSYTPDFYLPKEDKWIEVKGWMDDKSKTKLNRFKKYYPEEYNKLELIQSKEYKSISKLAPFIKEWE